MSAETLTLQTAVSPCKESSGTGQADLHCEVNTGQMSFGADLTLLKLFSACYRLTCHCIMSCPLSVLCFLQWHRPAASRDRVFTVHRVVRVTLIHLSNLQRIRQDKAWVSLKVQARPDKKFSSESTTPVALLTCNSPPRGHDFSCFRLLYSKNTPSLSAL